MDVSSLVEKAYEARTHSMATYSGFQVGAALECADGAIFGGCNIENASYGLTICAERVALFKALSEGQRQFARIVVVTDGAKPTPPCGPCRQLLWEFAGDLEVLVANAEGVQKRYTMKELLPDAFDADNLEE